MIVQIYEIQTPAEAEAMIPLGVDHIGSVVTDPDLWQDPVLRQTIDLVKSSGKRSSLIPLVAEKETVFRIIEYYRPHIIHFCDRLSKPDKAVEIQLEIKKRYPELEIMRSVPVPSARSADKEDCLQLAKDLEPVSDWLLIDTVVTGQGPQPVEGFIGITGKTCDWNLARMLVERSRIPVILAGGLGPRNVSQAVAMVKPAGVDSCTLTNARDLQGRPIRFSKDPQKVMRFVQAAKNTDLV